MLCQNIESRNSAAAAVGQQILGDRKPLKRRCFGEWTPSRKTKKPVQKRYRQPFCLLICKTRGEPVWDPCLQHLVVRHGTKSQTSTRGKKSATRMPTARSNALMKLSYVSEHQGTPCRRKAENGKQEVPCPETERTFNLLLKSVIRQSWSL